MSSIILIPSGGDLAPGHLSDVLPVTMTLGSRRPVGLWLNGLGCFLVSPKALRIFDVCIVYAKLTDL